MRGPQEPCRAPIPNWWSWPSVCVGRGRGGAQVAPGNLGRVGGPGLPQRERPPIRRNVCQIDVGTGVTRGKRLVVLVGQKKAVAIAVRNASGRRRWSKLA